MLEILDEDAAVFQKIHIHQKFLGSTNSQNPHIPYTAAKDMHMRGHSFSPYSTIGTLNEYLKHFRV